MSDLMSEGNITARVNNNLKPLPGPDFALTDTEPMAV